MALAPIHSHTEQVTAPFLRR